MKNEAWQVQLLNLVMESVSLAWKTLPTNEILAMALQMTDIDETDEYLMQLPEDVRAATIKLAKANIDVIRACMALNDTVEAVHEASDAVKKLNPDLKPTGDEEHTVVVIPRGAPGLN